MKDQLMMMSRDLMASDPVNVSKGMEVLYKILSHGFHLLLTYLYRPYLVMMLMKKQAQGDDDGGHKANDNHANNSSMIPSPPPHLPTGITTLHLDVGYDDANQPITFGFRCDLVLSLGTLSLPWALLDTIYYEQYLHKGTCTETKITTRKMI